MPQSKPLPLVLLGTAVVAAFLIGIYYPGESGGEFDQPVPISDAGRKEETKQPAALGEVRGSNPPVEALAKDVQPVPVRIDTGRWNLELASIDANFDLGLGNDRPDRKESVGARETSSGSGGAPASRAVFFPSAGGGGVGGGGGGGGFLFVPTPGSNNNPDGPLPDTVVVVSDNLPDPQTIVPPSDPLSPDIPPAIPLVNDFGPNRPNSGDGSMLIPLADTSSGKNDSDTPTLPVPVQTVTVPDETIDQRPVVKVPDRSSALGLLLLVLPGLVAVRRRITR